MLIDKQGARLGLDLGSVSISAVVIDSNGEVLFKDYRRTNGYPADICGQLIEQMQRECGDLSFAGACVTGSGKKMIADALDISIINEISAHARAAWTLYPQVRSIIEIGGQDSKYSIIGQDKHSQPVIEHHVFNELCAAGTGAFLDQQARRLDLSIDKFAELAGAATKRRRVAGRCAVFAKTDMIHYQQQNVHVEEIAAGLCFALARNFLATLCRGRKPSPPVLFQGGVAKNAGVVKAFRELLGLNESELWVPPNPEYMGAIGAALHVQSASTDSFTLKDFWGKYQRHNFPAINGGNLRPLSSSYVKSINRHLDKREKPFHPPFSLGIDLGSISIKGVVIDRHKNLVASACRATHGELGKVTAGILNELNLAEGDMLISQVALTGSGRTSLSRFFPSAVLVDEITAQGRACGHFSPEVDTLFEIGGQDAKFIRLLNGKIKSFKMNKVCAAGCGSFLEEQAGRLNVSIQNEFSALALQSNAPVKLGSRCTVFMDSDLVHYIQHGVPVADLCAGLAYCVAENYLEKVVGQESIGATIAFQGGVANNEAVLRALEQLSGKKIYRHDAPELTGAVGAALLAMEESCEQPGLQGVKLSEIALQIADSSLVGDNAGQAPLQEFHSKTDKDRNGSRQVITPNQSLHGFSIRNRLLHQCVDPPLRIVHGQIGLPLALTMHDYLPFWGTFFHALGYETVLSDTSSSDLIEEGCSLAPADVCYPIKVLFGHVTNLYRRGIRKIFVPQLRKFVPSGEAAGRPTCPYTQAAPFLIKEAMLADGEVLHVEYPSQVERNYWVEKVADQLQLDKSQIVLSLDKALAAQSQFAALCLGEGKIILNELARKQDRGIVLIGRPYNTADSYVSLNLADKLKGLGVEPIPIDFLPLDGEPLPELWSRLRWGYGRNALKAARIAKKNPLLGAVVVSNFGCGPDAFVDQYLEYELREIPLLMLELDDHQADTGLVTRLEAFVRSFSTDREPQDVTIGKDPGKPRRPLKDYIYYVPAFMDHAHAIAGALRASGCRTELLPPTDRQSWELGLKHTKGKECHPFISLAGDFLKVINRPDFDASSACFYAPSYLGPCLLPQYPLALHLLLERLGVAEATVMNILDETNMQGLGYGYLMRLALGLYAIDRLFKWKTEIVSVATDTQHLEMSYRQSLKLIEDGIAEKCFFKGLKRAVSLLAQVKLVAEPEKKPRIGIVGDVFTRINEHSNNGLYQHLHNTGHEVWASSTFIDVFLLSLVQKPEELRRSGQIFKGKLATLLWPGAGLVCRLIDQYFPHSIENPQERISFSFNHEIQAYVDPMLDKGLSLNVARVREFARNGTDGIINVMCHNCMLGTITNAFIERLSGEHGGVPICTLKYDGQQCTHNNNRLEAFADQTASFSNRKLLNDQ